jgi:hypothetical protein
MYFYCSFNFLIIQVTAKLVQDKSNECSSTEIHELNDSTSTDIDEYEESQEEAQFIAMRDYRRLLTNPALYKREKTSKQVRL